MNNFQYTNTGKLKIFFSHAHLEKSIVHKIQNAIDVEFGGFVDFFVSSDGESIRSGENFLQSIERNLFASNFFIFCVSPSSIKKEWINFELGAAWYRKVSSTGNQNFLTVPLCHSGLKLADLPLPWSLLNAIEATDPSGLKGLFADIQHAAGVKGILRAEFGKLSEEIKLEESKILAIPTIKEIVNKIMGSDLMDYIVNHVLNNPKNFAGSEFHVFSAVELNLSDYEYINRKIIQAGLQGVLRLERGQNFSPNGFNKSVVNLYFQKDKFLNIIKGD
ncbi:toll/interleukin-1 receptor domain-containing protein [Niveispirillum sp. SYP-B3756]|uniref:TIR domain-containing protein n=1 Tax=Niveispirillum sp. SYP-B3756 TaxID=2662178 RepID=UPI0012929463